MNFPSELKYSKSHEWVESKGDVRTCGITDYAQKEISDVVFVEVPKVGRVVKQGEAIAVVESVKAAFDIYSPLSGEVTASNKDLEQNPVLANQDPYGKGWFFKIKPSNATELTQLFSSADYEKHIKEGAH